MANVATAKPPFDPNAPFQPADAQKPPFDPSKPFDDADNEGFVNKAFNAVEDVGSKFMQGTNMYPGMQFLNKVVNPAIQKYVSAPIGREIYKLQTGKESPEENPSSESLMSQGGPDWEKTPLSSKLPGLYNDTGAGWKLRKGGPLDLSLAKAGGAGLDVLRNPLVGLGLMSGAPEAAESEVGAGIKAAAQSPLVQETESGLLGKLKQQTGAVGETNTPLEQLQAEVEKAKQAGFTTVLPEYNAISKIEKELPELDIKPIQKKAYTSQAAKDVYSTLLDMPTEGSVQMRQIMAIQKQKAEGIINDAINNLSDNVKPSETLRGENTIGDILDTYNQRKDNMKPLWNAIDNVPVPPALNGNLLSAQLGKALNLNKFIVRDISPSGAVSPEKLLPYNMGMGISRGTYNLINDTLDTVNNNQLTIREMRALRETLRSHVNPTGPAVDNAAVYAMRNTLANHIEDITGKIAPGYRELSRGWARNENLSDQLAQNLGGDLDNQYKVMDTAVPELAMKKLFSNTNGVKVLREFLGPEKFNDARANYLAHLQDNATKNDVFSGAKMATEMENHQAALDEAFKDNPAPLVRAKNASDYIRLISNFPTSNPSGTAKASGIMGAVKNQGLWWLERPDLAAMGALKNIAHETFSKGKENRMWNDLHSGRKGLLDVIDDIKKK